MYTVFVAPGNIDGGCDVWDLKAEVGFPYLYQHLGGCQHTLMVLEARYIMQIYVEKYLEF